jgi:hypothetical protein
MATLAILVILAGYVLIPGFDGWICWPSRYVGYAGLLAGYAGYAAWRNIWLATYALLDISR